ncbi:MAG: carbohydrate ABC transporter permease [Candidatus Hydrogenedentota bacterium]|nr:MAG: carbohydrate ABC transporter permease [Candidatus Hydrogenedentota bacterium]
MRTDSSEGRRTDFPLLYAAATLCLIITVAPFAWMFLSSIKPTSEILKMPPVWLPSTITFEHYRRLWSSAFASSMVNSAVVSISITLTTILVNSMAGFAFAKYRFPGRERLFTLLLATMMIPGQVTMIPVFILLKYLGLLNSYTGLVLPGTASVFAIFLMRQFMMGIPDSVLEAARLDGASEPRLFAQIVLPLAMPAIATLVIFTFMASWNEFLWALIIMLDESKYTVPVALAALNGQYGTDWGLLMAGSVVTILPVLGVFLLMQKHYIRGIATSGLKG